MLLRSSSTPTLGSLIDTRHRAAHSLDRVPSLPSSASPDGASAPKHVSFPSPRTPNHRSAPFLNCSSNSASPDRDSPTHAGFRRVRSEGNMERLAQYLPVDLRLPQRMPAGVAPLLDTIPSSVAVYGDGGDAEDPEVEDESLIAAGTAAATMDTEGAFSPERSTVMMADSVAICAGSADWCCGVFEGEAAGEALPPLYLARGLGIDSGLFAPGDGASGKGGGGGGGGVYRVATGNGGDRSADLETFYRRMVEENPSDAIFLRNYAEFLYQTKGDLRGAEEYYTRAILAEPGDGEVLSKYAKLVWELHHDQERTSGYFERAVQAAPHDSGVLAAYANFLWETDDENDGEDDDGGGGKCPGTSGGGPGVLGGAWPPRQALDGTSKAVASASA